MLLENAGLSPTKEKAMFHLLLASLGGAIGAGLRFWVGSVTLRHFGPGFPWGTFIVNITGSLLMGIVIGILVRKTGVANEWRIFIATGVLGGFTTFSAFSLDALNLWERGEHGMAAGYVFGSVIFSLAAVLAGIALIRNLG